MHQLSLIYVSSYGNLVIQTIQRWDQVIYCCTGHTVNLIPVAVVLLLETCIRQWEISLSISVTTQTVWHFKGQSHMSCCFLFSVCSFITFLLLLLIITNNIIIMLPSPLPLSLILVVLVLVIQGDYKWREQS